jgi:hypothetical protein
MTASRHTIDLANISFKASRLRALQPEKVAELAESMAALGLLQPIVVRPEGKGYWLIAGRHRLEAARTLKWTLISATVLDARRETAPNALARAAVEAPEGGRARYGAQPPRMQMSGANRVHLFARRHMVGMRLSALRLPPGANLFFVRRRRRSSDALASRERLWLSAR